MTHIKRKGGVTSTSPINSNQGEYYHQNNDVVKFRLGENNKLKQLSSKGETRENAREKARILENDLRNMSMACFELSLNILVKDYGLSKDALRKTYKSLHSPESDDNVIDALTLITDDEPLDQPVTIRQCCNVVYEALKTYVSGSEDLLVRSTLWIAHTYFIDELERSPFALITSPQSNCGKSTLATIINHLSNRHFPGVATTSEAALNRIISAKCPTISLDEADLTLKGNPAIHAMLNASNTRSGALSIRADTESSKVIAYKTFCPKIITGIRSTQLRDTLTNRSIVLSMKRKNIDDNVSPLVSFYADPIFKVIRRMLKRASIDAISSGEFKRSWPKEAPITLTDSREVDNWIPLLIVAKMAGDDWLKRAYRASRETDQSDRIDYSNLFVDDVLDILEQFPAEHYTSEELAKKLIILNPDWLTANKGCPINSRYVGNRLSGYGLSSIRIRRSGIQVRAYKSTAIQEALEIYNKSKEADHFDDNEEIKTYKLRGANLADILNDKESGFNFSNNLDTPFEFEETATETPIAQDVDFEKSIPVHFSSQAKTVTDDRTFILSSEESNQDKVTALEGVEESDQDEAFFKMIDDLQIPELDLDQNPPSDQEKVLFSNLLEIAEDIQSGVQTTQSLVNKLLDLNWLWKIQNHEKPIDAQWLISTLSNRGIQPIEFDSKNPKLALYQIETLTIILLRFNRLIQHWEIMHPKPDDELVKARKIPQSFMKKLRKKHERKK